MKTLKARIARLERQKPGHGRFVYPSMEAARAAGATGGLLIVRGVMTLDEWMRVAPAQQAKLLESIHRETTH